MKRVIGTADCVSPMNLPNVALNVITHEIGHGSGSGTTAIPEADVRPPGAVPPAPFSPDTPHVFR